MSDFRALAANMFDKIAGSDNATDDDAIMFNVVLAGQQKQPTVPTTAITDQCFITIQPLGGASYKLTFRINTDTGTGCR